MADKILELETFATTDKFATAVTAIQSLIEAVKAMYPVGSVITTAAPSSSVSPPDPNDFLGGTWEAYGSDRFLLGSGTKSAGASGGSSTHRHKIGFGVNDQALFVRLNGSDAYYGGVETGLSSFKVMNGSTANAISDAVVSGSAIWETKNESYVESYSQTADSYPPYVVVSFWKRTA